MRLRLTSAGFQTTVQDCGRFGFRKYGVATAGALDSVTLRVLNLAVGNPECAAGLEMTSGQIRLQFQDERLLAWSGGDFDVRIGQTQIPARYGARVSEGETLAIRARLGRAWLAVSGGIDVPLVLGSRSTDLRARFGGLDGRALRDGDELPLGESGKMAARVLKQMASAITDWSAPSLSTTADGMILRVIPGRNWANKVGDELLRAIFRVAINSDRMGLRLEGTEIGTSQESELVSEPIVPGTIQLPRTGGPIVLLADCQTIGGYRKLAHVITVDFARAAQLQPMDQVRFELTTLDHAQQLLRDQERDLALFRAGMQARFG